LALRCSADQNAEDERFEQRAICRVLLECDIVVHGERCDTHPDRRWGVTILGLRKRLAADLALHPNWEARAPPL
jgi:hypothetical protein